MRKGFAKGLIIFETDFRKVVSSHNLLFKTALKNTYTTSEAVSWDRQTTF